MHFHYEIHDCDKLGHPFQLISIHTSRMDYEEVGVALACCSLKLPRPLGGVAGSYRFILLPFSFLTEVSTQAAQKKKDLVVT